MMPVIPAIEYDIVEQSYVMQIIERINDNNNDDEINGFYSIKSIEKILDKILSIKILILKSFGKKLNLNENIKNSTFLGLGLISILLIIFSFIFFSATFIPLFIYILDSFIPELIEGISNIISLLIGFFALSIIIIPSIIIISIIWIIISIFE